MKGELAGVRRYWIHSGLALRWARFLCRIEVRHVWARSTQVEVGDLVRGGRAYAPDGSERPSMGPYCLLCGKSKPKAD